MSDESLNFNPDDLGGFGNTPNPGNDDLGAFDAASGLTVIPPGSYLCRLECGELVTTSTNKIAYRLRFAVVEPIAHAGFTLWRYYVVSDPSQANRSKAALAPLGLRTSADLRRTPFPEAGRAILCRVLVVIQKNDPTRNDVERFTVERNDPDGGSAATRFALPPDKPEGGVA